MRKSEEGGLFVKTYKNIKNNDDKYFVVVFTRLFK